MKCKCCGNEAVWCGDGTKLNHDQHDCSHIHCDYCGMHYSLEGNEKHDNAKSVEESRSIMLSIYEGKLE